MESVVNLKFLDCVQKADMDFQHLTLGLFFLRNLKLARLDVPSDCVVLILFLKKRKLSRCQVTVVSF